MFCNGENSNSHFSYSSLNCWCCIFPYLFSISTHDKPTCLVCSLLSLAFSKKLKKVLVFYSFPSYVMLKWGHRKPRSDWLVFKHRKGDSDLPLSLLISLLPLRLFRPNVIIQISPPLQLRFFCLSMSEKKHARNGTRYILLNSESVTVHRQILACAKPC